MRSFLPKAIVMLAFFSQTTSGQVSWVNTAAPPVYEISGHTGGFTTGISIIVRSFRGLEPSIALSYNSSGRNGFAGVGWDLSGVDLIERRNKDGGWPRFDSTDTYGGADRSSLTAERAEAPAVTREGRTSPRARPMRGSSITATTHGR